MHKDRSLTTPASQITVGYLWIRQPNQGTPNVLEVLLRGGMFDVLQQVCWDGRDLECRVDNCVSKLYLLKKRSVQRNRPGGNYLLIHIHSNIWSEPRIKPHPFHQRPPPTFSTFPFVFTM